jgi:hypothetical protein
MWSGFLSNQNSLLEVRTVSFNEKVEQLAARSKHATEHALTEEATKTSVVMPLLQSLGYDIFSLDEVIPEFVADVGTKKGEKVDFAVKVDGQVRILLEVKPISSILGKSQLSQLYRYFSVTDARIAMLTNGREVWFFSDIDERNRMDRKPFFVFDRQSYDEEQVRNLARFQKDGFDVDAILEAASNLKYVGAAANFLKSQLDAPSDDFTKFVGRQIYDGMLTKGVVEQLRPAIAAALDDVIRDRIQDRLNISFKSREAESKDIGDETGTAGESNEKADVETTDEEWQAFFIVRAIAAKVIDIERITIRDARTYCSVFADDNNRKPICRFYFNAKSVKHVGVFSPEKVEEKIEISDLSDIYRLANRIEVTAAHYA